MPQRSSISTNTAATVALLCALLFALPQRSFAAPENPDDGCLQDEVCRGHYEHAVALFEQSHFEAALPEFQAAYAQRQMPWLLLNIGRTLHRLGRPKEALEHYEMFGKAEPRMDAETRQRLEKYTAQAQAQATVTGPPTTTTATSTPPTTINTKPVDTGSAEKKPLYKKWWFWTAVGGGAVVVIVTAIAIGVSVGGSSSLPGDVMTYKPTF
jgi:tetratricopeptide (TPR) repeat protein